MTPAFEPAFISTYTGRHVDVTSLRPTDIDIVDVAHSLAFKSRYNGHTSQFYSVAEHCWIMSKIVEPQFAFEALMHDATETYIPDMPRPLKKLFPDFNVLERMIWLTMAEKWKLPNEMSCEVKQADRMMVRPEMTQLLGNAAPKLDLDKIPEFDPAKFKGLPCWNPRVAEDFFLRRYEELWEEHRAKFQTQKAA